MTLKKHSLPFDISCALIFINFIRYIHLSLDTSTFFDHILATHDSRHNDHVHDHRRLTLRKVLE